MAAPKLSDEERKAAIAELKAAQDRDNETPEQKWVRSTIREEIKDFMSDFFADDPTTETKPKDGGPGDILGNLFGRKTGS
jgi:hypothetical protein